MGAGASFVEDDSDYDDVDAAMLLGGRYIDDAGPRARRMQPYGGESDGNSAVAAMHALMAMGGRGGFGVSDDSFPPDQYTQQHVQDLGGGHIRIIHRSVHRIGRGGELSPTDGPIGAEIGEGALATSPASRGPRFLGAAASSSASSVATTSYAPSLGSRRTSAGGPSILPRYACHQCHRTFILREGSGIFCPYCNCDFVEEIEHSALAATRSSGSSATGGNGHGSSPFPSSLTADQQVRLIGAAAFLQMLEIHLRDEILSLRSALDAGAGSAAAKAGPRKLTGRERHAALRTMLLDTDSVCGQPSCPICSEDFAEGMAVTQIQCSHFFHDACVLPWLEMKRSCPICRFEISAAAPNPDALAGLTESELRGRIRWLGGPWELKGSKPDLAAMLCREISQHLEKFQGTDEEDDEEEQGDGAENLPLGIRSARTAPIAPSSVLGALTTAAASGDAHHRTDLEQQQQQRSRVVMRPGYTYTISSSGAISAHLAPHHNQAAASGGTYRPVTAAPTPSPCAGRE